MGSLGVHDPLEAVARTQQQLLGEVASLRAEVSGAIASVMNSLNNLEKRQHDEHDLIRDQIRQQAESKFWKVMYVVIPVMLGFAIWWLQIGTNQKVDAESKKLATRLALTEEFYKRKIAVYEAADNQMASVMGSFQDLLVDLNNTNQKKQAVDNLRKLTEMSKTHGLFMTGDVSEALADVSFTGASMEVLNGKTGGGLVVLSGKVARADELMKRELPKQFESFDTH